MTEFDSEPAAPTPVDPDAPADDAIFAAFGAAPTRIAALSAPERPELESDLSASEAFAHLARAGARRMAETARAFLLTDDPEAAHQLRVALRRHRSLLKLMRPALTRAFRQDQNARARALLRAIGPIRETDVLALETLPAARAAAPETLSPAFDALIYRLGAEAAAHRTRLRAGPFGAALGLLLTDLEAALASGDWRAEAEPVSATKAAKQALTRTEKQLAAWGARMDALTIPERHEMRKTAKTLRYAVEFFGSLFEEKKVAPYRRALKKLQEGFGALNDAAEAVKLRRLILGEAADPALVEAVEAAIAASETTMQEAFPLAEQRWRALKSTPRFWPR